MEPCLYGFLAKHQDNKKAPVKPGANRSEYLVYSFAD